MKLKNNAFTKVTAFFLAAAMVMPSPAYSARQVSTDLVPETRSELRKDLAGLGILTEDGRSATGVPGAGNRVTQLADAPVRPFASAAARAEVRQVASLSVAPARLTGSLAHSPTGEPGTRAEVRRDAPVLASTPVRPYASVPGTVTTTLSPAPSLTRSLTHSRTGEPGARAEVREGYFVPGVTGQEDEAVLNRLIAGAIDNVMQSVEAGVRDYNKELVASGRFESFPEASVQRVLASVREWLLDPSLDRYTKRGILKAVAAQRWKNIDVAHGAPVEFGTAGVRGPAALTLEELEELDAKGFQAEILKGPGTINNVSLAKLTTGVARYHRSVGKIKVAITYDSRVQGKALADFVAAIFLHEGLTVYLFDETAPMPEMSFSVAHFKLDLGIIISASHNPPESQGYKVASFMGAQLDPVTRDNVMDVIFGLPRPGKPLREGQSPIPAVQIEEVAWILKAAAALKDPLEVYKLPSGEVIGPLVRQELQKLPQGRLVILGDKDMDQDPQGIQHIDIHNRHADHVVSHVLRPEMVRAEAANMRRVTSPMYGNSQNDDQRIAVDRMRFVNTGVVREFDFFKEGGPTTRKSLFRHLLYRRIENQMDSVIPDPGNSAGHALAWEEVMKDYLKQTKTEMIAKEGSSPTDDQVIVRALKGLNAMDGKDPDSDRLGVNVTVQEAELPPVLRELDSLPPLSTQEIQNLKTLSSERQAHIIARVGQLIFFVVPKHLRKDVGFAALKLLSANDTWAALLAYRIDRLAEMMRGETLEGGGLPPGTPSIPSGLKFTVVKTHVTTDAMRRVAENANQRLGLDIETIEPYVGFTLVAELILRGWEEGKINLAGAEESGGFSFGGAPPVFFTLMHLFQKYGDLSLRVDENGSIVTNHPDPLLTLERDSYFGYSSQEIRDVLEFLQGQQILKQGVSGDYKLEESYQAARTDHEQYWGKIQVNRAGLNLRQLASQAPCDRLGKRGHTLEKDGLLASVLMLEVGAYAHRNGATLYEYIQNRLYQNPAVGYLATTNQALEFEKSSAGRQDKVRVLQRALELARQFKDGRQVMIHGRHVTGVEIFIPKTQKYAAAYAQDFLLKQYQDLIGLIGGDGKDFLKANPGERIKSFFPEEGVRFHFGGSPDDHLTIRPSGTEPKIRFYVQVVGASGGHTAEDLIADAFKADSEAVQIAWNAQDIVSSRSELRNAKEITGQARVGEDIFEIGVFYEDGSFFPPNTEFEVTVGDDKGHQAKFKIPVSDTTTLPDLSSTRIKLGLITFVNARPLQRIKQGLNMYYKHYASKSESEPRAEVRRDAPVLASTPVRPYASVPGTVTTTLSPAPSLTRSLTHSRTGEPGARAEVLRPSVKAGTLLRSHVARAEVRTVSSKPGTLKPGPEEEIFIALPQNGWAASPLAGIAVTVPSAYVPAHNPRQTFSTLTLTAVGNLASGLAGYRFEVESKSGPSRVIKDLSQPIQFVPGDSLTIQLKDPRSSQLENPSEIKTREIGQLKLEAVNNVGLMEPETGQTGTPQPVFSFQSPEDTYQAVVRPLQGRQDGTGASRRREDLQPTGKPVTLNVNGPTSLGPGIPSITVIKFTQEKGSINGDIVRLAVGAQTAEEAQEYKRDDIIFLRTGREGSGIYRSARVLEVTASMQRVVVQLLGEPARAEMRSAEEWLRDDSNLKMILNAKVDLPRPAPEELGQVQVLPEGLMTLAKLFSERRMTLTVSDPSEEAPDTAQIQDGRTARWVTVTLAAEATQAAALLLDRVIHDIVVAHQITSVPDSDSQQHWVTLGIHSSPDWKALDIQRSSRDGRLMARFRPQPDLDYVTGGKAGQSVSQALNYQLVFQALDKVESPTGWSDSVAERAELRQDRQMPAINWNEIDAKPVTLGQAIEVPGNRETVTIQADEREDTLSVTMNSGRKVTEERVPLNTPLLLEPLGVWIRIQQPNLAQPKNLTVQFAPRAELRLSAIEEELPQAAERFQQISGVTRVTYGVLDALDPAKGWQMAISVSDLHWLAVPRELLRAVNEWKLPSPEGGKKLLKWVMLAPDNQVFVQLLPEGTVDAFLNGQVRQTVLKARYPGIQRAGDLPRELVVRIVTGEDKSNAGAIVLLDPSSRAEGNVFYEVWIQADNGKAFIFSPTAEKADTDPILYPVLLTEDLSRTLLTAFSTRLPKNTVNDEPRTSKQHLWEAYNAFLLLEFLRKPGVVVNRMLDSNDPGLFQIQVGDEMVWLKVVPMTAQTPQEVQVLEMYNSGKERPRNGSQPTHTYRDEALKVQAPSDATPTQDILKILFSQRAEMREDNRTADAAVTSEGAQTAEEAVSAGLEAQGRVPPARMTTGRLTGVSSRLYTPSRGAGPAVVGQRQLSPTEIVKGLGVLGVSPGENLVLGSDLMLEGGAALRYLLPESVLVAIAESYDARLKLEAFNRSLAADQLPILIAETPDDAVDLIRKQVEAERFTTGSKKKTAIRALVMDTTSPEALALRRQLGDRHVDNVPRGMWQRMAEAAGISELVEQLRMSFQASSRSA